MQPNHIEATMSDMTKAQLVRENVFLKMEINRLRNQIRKYEKKGFVNKIKTVLSIYF
jgi:regulator of replication initiation timing